MSPEREVLKAFGGYMTIDEYRTGFMCITNYEWIELFFHRCHDFYQTFRMVKKSGVRVQRAWGFEYVTYPAPPGTMVDHVNILPLSNKTLRQCDLVTVDAPQTVTTRRTSEPKAKPTNNAELQGTRRSRPSCRNRSMTQLPTTIRSPPPPAPKQPMTNEEVLAINEEQAFYATNLRQFGNLLDTMGISISKPQLDH